MKGKRRSASHQECLVSKDKRMYDYVIYDRFQVVDGVLKKIERRFRWGDLLGLAGLGSRLPQKHRLPEELLSDIAVPCLRRCYTASTWNRGGDCVRRIFDSLGRCSRV